MVIDSDSRKSVVKVSISKVSVELGGKQILNNVSMEIPSGSFTAIVGPNGSGKTTLLRAIFGALKPQTGTITFDDLNIRGQTTRQLARLRSVVPQGQDAHSDLTVKTTIELARLSQVKWWQNALLRGDEVVDQAIATTGIAPMLSQPMATLSGGQRQRVLIARAIAQDTPIVLLDEPTNHLDPSARFEILDLLRDLEKTRIMVAHDLDLALRYCDHVHVLEDGACVLSGKPSDVFESESLQDVFRLRTRIVESPFSSGSHLLTDRKSQ